MLAGSHIAKCAVKNINLEGKVSSAGRRHRNLNIHAMCYLGKGLCGRVDSRC